MATSFLWTNNSSLKGGVEKYLKEAGLKIIEANNAADYQIYLLDITVGKEADTSELIGQLETPKNKSCKTCLVIIDNSQNASDSIEKYTSLVGRFLRDKTIDFRLVRTLDIYSGEFLSLDSPFQRVLYSATLSQKIIVSTSGDNHYYPTSLSDLCDLITKSLFISNTAGEIFTGIGEDMTDLDLAYLIKKSLEKKDKTFDIDLSGSAIGQSYDYFDASVRTQALLNWLPKIDLSDQIDEIVAPALNEEDQSREIIDTPVTQLALTRLDRRLSKPNPKIVDVIKKFSRSLKKKEVKLEDLHQTEKRGLTRIIIFLVSGVALLAILPLILTAGSLYLSAGNTYQAYQFLRQGNEPEARTILTHAKFWQAVSQSSFQRTIPLVNLFSRPLVANTGNFITVLGHGQTVLESGLDSYSLGSQLYLGLLGRQSIDSHANLVALRVNLVSLSEKLSQIQLLIDQIKLPYGYDRKIKTSDLNGQIDLLKSQINLGLPLLELIDKVVINQSRENYLIVVVDPNELRPTGGFLTSHILVSLDQGKITNLRAESSLVLDRLIAGKIEPPSVLKQLLSQTTWAYRDSNLDANFPASANQISWFYQRFKNITLDGVISLNLTFFEALLAEIGEQQLADGVVVNTGNLNQLASNPTSGKGADIITALTGQLSQKLINGEIKFALFSRALLKSVSYNEINLWFPKPELQALSQDSRLSGDIRLQPCHPQLAFYGCQADLFYLNESNFSVSKLNYYLKRTDNILINIGSSGEVGYTITYDYTYPVPAPTNLAQSYKAYYQVFLPGGSRNLLISLDNQVITQPLIKQTALGGINKLEFSSQQIINQPHRLVIKFTSAKVLDLKKPQIPFTLSYLKQPGTLKNAFSVKVLYPQTLQPKTMTVPFIQTGASELSFQMAPASHEDIGLLFKNLAL
jgi:hypothetical protein